MDLSVIPIDVTLVVGVVLAVLSVPPTIAAWAASRFPVTSLIFMALGSAMVGFAYLATPGGLTLSDIPIAITEVIGRYIL